MAGRSQFPAFSFKKSVCLSLCERWMKTQTCSRSIRKPTMHSDLCGVAERRCILRGNLQSQTKDLLFQHLHVVLCRLHPSIQHNLPHETAPHAAAGYWTLTQTDPRQFGWAATASTQHRSPPGLCANPTPFNAVHR